jgi:hypothetical protein
MTSTAQNELRAFLGHVKGLTLDVEGFDAALELTPTEATHAHISTGSGQRAGYLYRGDVLPLYVSLHIERDEEKGWHVSNSHISRDFQDATPTLRARVEAATLEAFLGWTSDNEETLQEAERRKASDNARTIEQTISRLETVLEIMRNKLEASDRGEIVSPYVPDEHRNIF